jgi:hypothetical protein
VPRAWVREGALTVSVPPEGLWIGRAPDCDLVVADHRASQLHAFLGWRGDRLVLLGLGRNPTRRNGAPIEGPTVLTSGDQVEVPGRAFTVDLPDAGPVSAWVAALPSGERVGLGRREVSLGGGPDDDLSVRGWSPGAARLHRTAGGALLLEALAPLAVDGRACEEGALEEIHSGARIALEGAVVTLLALDDGRPATTLLAGEAHLPLRVAFAFTPTGGVLTLSFARGAPRAVDLPELRARLVAALLAAPGEEVEDEDLLAAVWPGSPHRGRLDLNQLVHRARRDLLAAGVDPTDLLVRVRRGGAACFRVAPGASVTVT